MKAVRVRRAELLRAWASQKRYPLQFFTNLLSFSVTTLILMFGLDKLGGVIDIRDLVLFPVILLMVGAPSAAYRTDVESGVFEQIFNSGVSLAGLYLTRTFTNIISVVLPVCVLVIVSPLITKSEFILFNLVLSAVYLAILGITIGMFLLALSFRYRRLGSLSNMIHIVSIGLSFVKPSNDMLRILPFVNTIAIMDGNISSFGLLMLLLSIILWIILCLLFFRKLTVSAREKGHFGVH
jgi:hypothetical protein